MYQVYHIVTTSAAYYNSEEWSFRFVSLTGASRKSYVRPATKVLGKADVPLDRKTSCPIHILLPKDDDKQFFTRLRTGVLRSIDPAQLGVAICSYGPGLDASSIW